jgi:uncharacterized membrane protein YkvA (DUF1232 family)
MSATDPFPRELFMALVKRLPKYGRLAWTLSRHPKVKGKRRAALIAAAAYVLSPIDLVPGIIPVAGQLDDAAAVLIGLSLAMRSLTPDERRAALVSAGLTDTNIEEDLRSIRACYAWMGRAGLRLGRRGASLLARGAGRVARRVASSVSARRRRARESEAE